MNKKLFAILTAALLLLSATACTSTNEPGDTTDGVGTKDPDAYIGIGTDESGNPVTSVSPDTKEPETSGFDPSEQDPTFTDISKQVVVISAVATVRSSTQVVDNNGVGWPAENKVLTVTGESTNWYRITYPVNGEDATCYIAKTVVADASVLESFVAIEGEGEEVEVAVDALNVRSYPSAESNLSIRGTLKLGDKVVRVAANDKWSRILYQVVSETETDADGNALVETKEYYVSNDCLILPTTETTAAAE